MQQLGMIGASHDHKFTFPALTQLDSLPAILPLLLTLSLISAPPLLSLRVSTIDSLLIQSHYFHKHGHTVWLPLNHWAA